MNKYYILFFLCLLFQSCNKNNEEVKTVDIPNENKVEDNFIFVGLTDGKQGLYKYDFKKKSSEPLWFDTELNVVEFSYSENKKNAFILTAKKSGSNGAFPFINGLKLYLINSETDNVFFVEEIGNGIQFFAQWEGEFNFRIIINSFDKIFANLINHRVILYNVFGKKLGDRTDIYDLTIQGYPLPPGKQLNLFSPDRLFSVELKDNSMVLKDRDNKKETNIFSSKQEIHQVEWKDNLLFLSTIERDSINSLLIIYSTEDKRILKQWNWQTAKNFFIAGNYIVFDDDSKNNSKIVIYDFIDNMIYDVIEIEGGCGLRNISQTID